MRTLSRLLATTARFPLRGVVFDMDGTLTKPNLDFAEMYGRCGVPMEKDLLAEIALMSVEQRAAAESVIEEMEAEGRRTLELMPGAVQLASFLQRNEVPMAIVTRNSAATLEHFYSALWEPAGLRAFSPAISRDGEVVLPGGGASSSAVDAALPVELQPKPHPAALIAIARRWEVALPSESLLMVGDSPSNDIGFGRAAGVSTALLDSGRRYVEAEGAKPSVAPDWCVAELGDLPALLAERYELEHWEAW